MARIRSLESWSTLLYPSSSPTVIGKKVVITTGGKEGCWAFLDGRTVHFPAYPVQAVDTTGAGDVFHGAFLARWLETEDTVSAIRFASAVSALKCLRPGGRSGIPDREAADRLAAESP